TARTAISPRSLLRPGTPTAHERVALPLLPSGPGGVRRFPLRGAQPSTPPREAHSTRSALEREFNPAEADCGLQGTANSPSSTAKPNNSGGGAGIRTRGTGVTRARHFQCRTFGRSVTPPHAISDADAVRAENLAEGRGFEPPRDLLGPYPISSRTPSTGLGHPSAPVSSAVYPVSHCSRRMPPTAESQSCRNSTALTVLGATMAGAGAIFSTASTQCPGRQVRGPLNHAQWWPAAQRLDRSQVYRSSDETRSERVARSACYVTPSIRPASSPWATAQRVARTVRDRRESWGRP